MGGLLRYFAIENPDLTEEQFNTKWRKMCDILLHVYKCSDCRNKIDVAEYALLLREHRRGGCSSNLRTNYEIIMNIYVAFSDRVSTNRKLQELVKHLKEFLQSNDMVGLNWYIKRKFTTVSSVVFQGKSDVECSICFEKYKPEQIINRIEFCLHEFHVECLDRWLEKNSTCPYCRRVIRKKAAIAWCNNIV